MAMSFPDCGRKVQRDHPFPLPQSQPADVLLGILLRGLQPPAKIFQDHKGLGVKSSHSCTVGICPEDMAPASQKCNRSDGTAINLTNDFKLINHGAQQRNRTQGLRKLPCALRPKKKDHFICSFIHSFFLSISSC